MNYTCKACSHEGGVVVRMRSGKYIAFLICPAGHMSRLGNAKNFRTTKRERIAQKQVRIAEARRRQIEREKEIRRQRAAQTARNRVLAVLKSMGVTMHYDPLGFSRKKLVISAFRDRRGWTHVFWLRREFEPPYPSDTSMLEFVTS